MEKNSYWACTDCDSGGYPLTAATTADEAWQHIDKTGHCVLRGKIKE